MYEVSCEVKKHLLKISEEMNVSIHLVYDGGYNNYAYCFLDEARNEWFLCSQLEKITMMNNKEDLLEYLLHCSIVVRKTAEYRLKEIEGM